MTILIVACVFQLSVVPKGMNVKRKNLTPVPAIMKKQEAKKLEDSLFEKRPKDFNIGQDILSG